MRVLVSSIDKPALIQPSPILAALFSARLEWPPIRIGTGLDGTGHNLSSGIS